MSVVWELIEETIAAAQRAEQLLSEPDARRRAQEDPDSVIAALARQT